MIPNSQDFLKIFKRILRAYMRIIIIIIYIKIWSRVGLTGKITSIIIFNAGDAGVVRAVDLGVNCGIDPLLKNV
jgi:hypothetical protein